MQNEPNFPHFSTKNNDKAKKQTQFKPNQSQFWLKNKGNKAKTNPIYPELVEWINYSFPDIFPETSCYAIDQPGQIS